MIWEWVMPLLTVNRANDKRYVLIDFIPTFGYNRIYTFCVHVNGSQ